MTLLTHKFSMLTVVGTLLWTIPFTTAYTVGDTVADFILPDADGQPIRLSDFTGSVVMINFWTGG